MLARLLGGICLCLGLAAVLPSFTFAAEPRVALVIGNSEYGPAIGKLKNPANDAALIAETLKGLGFSVDLVLDADQKAMKRAVKGFGARLREAGSEATGLFYYAGHGVQVEGQNFLLPVGAEIGAEADVEIESISADDVMTQMQSAGNAVNLVFLDACRNNPLAKASRSATRGLARLDAPRGSFVGYSTAPGDVAADGDGANSPYALALAAELKKPGISVEEAHRNVRAKVLAESGNKQTPWDSSSLTGPVVLAQTTSASAPPTQLQQASIDKEALFWESIKDSKDSADFQAYLKRYPTGTFSDLAQNKIKALSSPASTPTTTKSAVNAVTVPPSAPTATDDATDSVAAGQATALATPAAQSDPPATAGPVIVVGEVYEMVSSFDGTNYRGELRVLRLNDGGELEGELDLKVSKQSGRKFAVRQDFRLQQRNGQVEIRCFNPRVIEGSNGAGTYSSDNFYLTLEKPGLYKGKNRDRNGNGGAVTLKLSMVAP